MGIFKRHQGTTTVGDGVFAGVMRVDQIIQDVYERPGSFPFSRELKQPVMYATKFNCDLKPDYRLPNPETVSMREVIEQILSLLEVRVGTRTVNGRKEVFLVEYEEEGE